MPRFLFACTAFFQYLMGMNQDKNSHSVVTIKLMSVLPTRLYLLPFNHEIVGTAKTYCFDQISVYQKLVVFFRIPLLNQKCFLKVVLYLAMYVLFKFRFSITNSQANALVNVFRKI